MKIEFFSGKNGGLVATAEVDDGRGGRCRAFGHGTTPDEARASLIRKADAVASSKPVYLNRDHGDDSVYVTVGDAVAALLRMPQDSPLLMTIHQTEGLDCREDTVTSIPMRVGVVLHEDYYHDKEHVVEIYAC